MPKAAANARVRCVTPESLPRIAGTAEPGDIQLLAPGNYGAFEATRDGSPRKPMVFRAAASDAAVFDRFSLQNRRHVYLEGVTVNGSVDLLGGEDLVVRRCTVHATYGIVAKQRPGARNCYIADNVVIGAMPWESSRMGLAQCAKRFGRVRVRKIVGLARIANISLTDLAARPLTMLILHARQQVGGTSGVRNGLGESAPAPPKRIPDR